VRWGKGIVVLGAVAACLAAPVARAEDTLPPTHAALVDSLAARAAGELLNGETIPAGRTVAVEQPVPGDTTGLFGQQLIQTLHHRGVPVRVVSAPGSWVATGKPDPMVASSADSTDLRLAVQVQSEGVAYVRAIRGLLGRPKAYERFAYLHASATLLDGPSGAVLWSHTASAESRDRVPRGDLEYVAAGAGRLNPVPPGGQGFRLLEPLIVIGVVAGLVVLFYSNRN
jgi:hypothetical protein